MSKYPVGTVVTITNSGDCYNAYEQMAIAMGMQHLWRQGGPNHCVGVSEDYTIVACETHPGENVTLYGLVPHGNGSHSTNFAIMGHEGVRAIGSVEQQPVTWQDVLDSREAYEQAKSDWLEKLNQYVTAEKGSEK